MSLSLRLRSNETGDFLVVDDGRVYRDDNGDGRINSADELPPDSEVARAARAAAVYIEQLFADPCPGVRSADGRFTSAGELNSAETTRLRLGEAILVRRPDVWAHLDFFDELERDGIITLRENYIGWRALGWGRIGAATKALVSGVVFGRARHGFRVDIEAIQERRPKHGTGIYDRATGNLSPARLEEYLKEFDRHAVNGKLGHRELEQLLAKGGPLGRVPRGQFRSLVQLTTKLNGSPTVTREQFIGLYDGSLLYVARAKVAATA
jgi:hypothetical protein